MKSRSRSLAGIAALLAMACLSLLLSATSSLADTPPWEPDPNSAAPYGSIAFYNAAGSVITSGSDLSHIADYAVASTPKSTGANLATLFFANPDKDLTTSEWSSNQVSSSTSFPNSSAPQPIASNPYPVVTLGPTDGNIAAWLGGISPDPFAGFENVYQVRLKDSGPFGAGSGSKYWSTDIIVDENAGTWAQIFPTPVQTATTTSLTVSPVNSQYDGMQVTLNATVSPAVPGDVQFKDGLTNLGSPVAVDGTGEASLNTTSLDVGSHSLTAVFSPTSTSHSGSTSSVVSYTIYGEPAWKPVLAGAHRIGLVEQCLAAFDDPAATLAYAWYYNGTPVSGATGAAYKVAEAYYGTKVSCLVTATNPVGSTDALSHSFTMGVGPALYPTSKPYLYRGSNRSTALHGAYEYVNKGIWSPAATSFSFQWYVGSSRINGATSYRFKPPSSYVGKYIYCLVTAKRLHWTNGVYKTRAVKVV